MGGLSRQRYSFQLGYEKVILEVDLKCLLQLVNGSGEDEHSCSTLVKAIKVVTGWDWSVIIKHRYREANFSVDTLAKYGHDGLMGLRFFHSLPPCLSNAFHGRLSWNFFFSY